MTASEHPLPALALGKLLGLSSLTFLELSATTDRFWLTLAPTSRFDAVLVAPARTPDEAGEVIAAQQARQNKQASFLEEAPTRERPGVAVIAGLLAVSRGPLMDEAGVVVWQVTEREARAAQRLLVDEAGLRPSLEGAAGFAALVRALWVDRQAPVRARRLPKSLAAVVVTLQSTTVTDGPPIAHDAATP